MLFATIYSNLQSQKIANFLTKTTYYRWLNGSMPHISIIYKCNEILHNDMPLAYIHNFITVASKLKNTNELEKVTEIVKNSSIKEEDKKLLSEYHKRRVWRNANKSLDINDEGLFL